MTRERRSTRRFVIPGVGLAVTLVLTAVWIWCSGTQQVQEVTGRRGPAPALEQRGDVDAERPYRLVHTSWNVEEEPLAQPIPLQPVEAPAERGLEFAVLDS